MFEILILICFGFLVFGINLWNRGLFCDGWFIDNWIREKKLKTLKHVFREAGIPYVIKIHEVLNRFTWIPNRYAWLSLLSHIGSSIAVYIFCNKQLNFSTNEAFLLALLYVTFPGIHLIFEKSLSNYFLCVFCFFIGINLVFITPSIFDYKYILGSILGIILLYYSFNLNSLLTFFYPFYFILISKEKYIFPCNTLERIEIIIYGILPIFYFIRKKIFYKSYGFYKNYNKLYLQPKSILFGFQNLYVEGVLKNYGKAFFELIKNPIFFTSALFLCNYLSFILQNPTNPILQENTETFIFSAGLFLAASIPYILVRQPFGSSGWATKNNLLLPLPLALIVFEIFLYIFANSTKNFYAAIVFIILTNSYYLIKVSLSYLAFWAKCLSIRQIWASKEPKNDFLVASIFDNFSISLVDAGRPEHWTISLSYMFNEKTKDFLSLCILGNKIPDDLKRYSYNEIWEKIQATTVPFLFNSLKNQKLVQFSIFINKNSPHDDFKTGIKFLFYYYLKKQKLEKFLSTMTDLKILTK